MRDKIIEQLKTGPVKNVVAYGMPLPAPPYIVVRPEQDVLSRGRSFRIIAHYLPGQHAFLEDYIFITIPQLLNDFMSDTRHGNFNQLLQEKDYVDILTNDDGTISMERRYLMPSILF